MTSWRSKIVLGVLASALALVPAGLIAEAQADVRLFKTVDIGHGITLPHTRAARQM